jgi:hypothetical protein
MATNEIGASWFETREGALLTMRGEKYDEEARERKT